MAVETKYCNKCTSTKRSSSFGKCSRNSDGLQSWCKECKKNNYQSKHLGLGKYSQVSYDVLSTMSEKFCWSCMTMKSRSDYSVDSSRKDRMQVECKKCKHTKVAVLNKKRYQSNIQVRIATNFRSRFNEIVRIKKINSNNSSIRYLGLNLESFKSYLESKFLKGMTWENYGSVWHMDHKVPCVSFDLTKESEIKKCFNYKNIQPLFATTEIAMQHGHMNEIGNLNKHSKLI